MDEKDIKVPCPYKDCEEVEMSPVYRWGLEPLENTLNFLPNFLYNEQKPKGKPTRFNSWDDLQKCGYCSLSMFISEYAAIEEWSKFPDRIRELLGYTHILVGDIDNNTGLVSSERPHFELFEYASSADLRERFTVSKALIVE